MSDLTPVLVGACAVQQRDAAREPLALMADALRGAGEPALLSRIERILVPRGRWRYRDPGRALATRVGAPGARTVLAQIGVPQSTLIGRVCAAIGRGEIGVAAVVGGDCGDRTRTARKAGEQAVDTVLTDEPDEEWTAEAELFHPAEIAAGLRDAAGFYALLESAFSAGAGPAGSRDEITRIYRRFSEIAADNPHAWHRAALSEAEIRDAPMVAFPYTRPMVSSWSVDQAGALLFCSAGVARELGVPADRWIFPLVNAESNHMLELCRRAELDRCPGAEVAGAAAFRHAGITAAELDLVELYSCFPVAVRAYALALGIDPGRDLTVTGGMSFAGGPLNNYVIQATCRMAELLRTAPGRGLVSTVSGLLTKQAVTLWSSEPGTRPFAHLDVTEEAAARSTAREAVAGFSGRGTVVAATVLHTADPPRAVLLLDGSDGRRGFGWSERPEVVHAVQSGDPVGHTVEVADSRLLGAGPG